MVIKIAIFSWLSIYNKAQRKINIQIYMGPLQDKILEIIRDKEKYHLLI